MTVSAREVAFESDGRRLIGHLFEADTGAKEKPSRPGVLFIHGYGSRPARVSAASRGCRCGDRRRLPHLRPRRPWPELGDAGLALPARTRGRCTRRL